jgi:hypothetical protein
MGDAADDALDDAYGGSEMCEECLGILRCYCDDEDEDGEAEGRGDG